MRNKVRTVIKMDYALKMEALGHKKLGTMPNNKDPEKLVWLFLEDETFDADLRSCIEEGRNAKKSI